MSSFRPRRSVARTVARVARCRVLALAALGLAAPPIARAELAPPPVVHLDRELVATDLGQPVAVTHAGDGRLFVTVKTGLIRVIEGGTLLPTPFLDIRVTVLSNNERGLLSVAFDPDYSANGFFYIDYNDRSGATVIARYRVSEGDRNRADPDSARIVLTIPQPFANHDGGQLAFGPDGYLYVAMGDGGSGFDPGCRAQRGSSLLGKLLRLDVRGASGPQRYAIPPDNPFVGDDGVRDEVWALGLRNPWRFSFDRLTGDLLIADVGQSQREEIDFEPAGDPGGHNYGWKVEEGSLCLGDTSGCDFPVPPCGSASYSRPVLEYDHSEGCAVIGGNVYRGTRIGDLQGTYLFGDYCSGTVWAAYREGGAWVRREAPGLAAAALTSFGEGLDGELYMTAGSSLYRILGPPPDGEGCTADDTTLCLGEGGRFRVRAVFRAGAEPSLYAHAAAITDDTGTFWFFDEKNLEVVVKTLDACLPFDRFWVFAAGLTNVETELVVTDTVGREEMRYPRPGGRAFAPIQDTGAFATCP